MDKKPVVIVYKSRNRDISPLDKACKALNFSLRVTESEDEFNHEFKTFVPSCLIVPLGSDEEGGDNAREFINMASNVLEPEDADLDIIYSTEGYTPARWLTNLEPRQIQSDDIDYPSFRTDDRGWRYTIERLERLQKRIRHQRYSHSVVKIEFANEDVVPFPSEATFLLRAAFKEMSSVTVEFPSQGLSGSIACFIQPIDASGGKCKRVFVKIYLGHEKAQKDLKNFESHVEPYFASDYYPPYQYRRYHGKAYSLLVTDLVKGPENKELTFKQMVLGETSAKFSLEKVRSFILNVLAILDEKWALKTPENRPDLLEEYIKKFLADQEKRIILGSENNCHRWFGDVSDVLELTENIRRTIPEKLLTGTFSKVCHGDLHAENIMVKSSGGSLVPVFIDFSRTGETHSLKDLVTLESDMIIRGLGSIKSFSDKKTFRSFLETLNFTTDNKECETEWTQNMNESLQLQKVQAIIKELRNNAISFHKVPPSEYECAALLKTLEVLSYGKLPHDKTVRATTYVTYLIGRLRKIMPN